MTTITPADARPKNYNKRLSDSKLARSIAQQRQL